MANDYFNERVLFQLPSDYICERAVNDNGDEYFKILNGEYTNDDGETDYEFCCFVSLLEYDPYDDNAADSVIEFQKGTDNTRIVKLSDKPKVYVKSLLKTFSIFGKPIIIFELSGQIRLSDCSLLELVTRKTWSEDESIDELSTIQKYLCVLSSVFIDGRKLPLDIVSATEIHEYLKVIASPEAQDISPKIQLTFNLNGEETTHEFHYDGTKQSFDHTNPDEQVNQELKASASCGIWFMLEKIVSMCKNTSYFTEDEIEIIEDGLTFHESLISNVLQRDSKMYESALSSNKLATNTILSIATDNGKAAISIFERALDKWIPPCYNKAFTLIALFFDIPYAPVITMPIAKKREIMQDCRGFVNSMQLAIAMADTGVEYTAPDYCDADLISVTHTRNNTVVAIDANEKNNERANNTTNGEGANGDTIEVVQLTENSEGVTFNFGEFEGYDGDEIHIALPEETESVGYNAFACNFSVQTVVLPEGVTTIDMDAFSLAKLSCIVLPSTLDTISSGAFHWCENLKEIILPDGLTEIGSDAFSGCDSLKYIYIPESVFDFGMDCFDGLDNCIFHVEPGSDAEEYIRENYEDYKIVYSKPVGYGNLPKIKIISKTAVVSADGFVIIEPDDDDVDSIFDGELTSYNGNAKRIRISDEFDTIESDAFTCNDTIEQVIISDSVTTINSDAFSFCKNLKMVVLPSNLDIISSSLFWGCANLEEVNIPDSVTEIEFDAFNGCTNLKKVTIPSSVSEIDEAAFDFEQCVFYVEKGSYADEFLQGLEYDVTIEYV